MWVTILHKALVAANLLLLLACLRLGSRLRRLCLVAIWLNTLALAILVIPIFSLLLSPQPLPQAPAAVRVLLTATFSILAEFLALLVVYHWRLRPR